MSEHEKKSAEAPVVVESPSGQRPGRRGPGKRGVIIGAIALVLLILIVLGSMWGAGVFSSGQKPTAKSTVPQLSGQALQNAVHRQLLSGDTAAAVKLIKGQDHSSFEHQKLLVTVYEWAHKPQKALDVYNRNDQPGKLKSFAADAGRLAAKLRENSRAIHYYKEAKHYSLTHKKIDRRWKAHVTDYNATLKRLQGEAQQ
jgi:hypothetical protein